MLITPHRLFYPTTVVYRKKYPFPQYQTENNNSEILRELSNGNPDLITAELVARAAEMGDESCLKIYNEVTEYLCKGIGTIANLLNPEVVYLGGGIASNKKLLFDLVQSKKSKYLLHTNTNMPILPSTFGEQATIIGAVSLVLEKIMNLELQ